MMKFYSKAALAAVTLLTAVCPALSGQEKDRGVVELSVCFMREKPGYEEELGNQALMGTPVEILGKEGYWLKIKSPEPYVAWVNEMAVTLMDSLEVKSYIAEPKYICVAKQSEIWTSPSSKSLRVCDLVQGDIVRIWYNDKGRPVKSGGCLGVILPSGRKGYVRAEDLQDFSSWAGSRQATADNVVNTAMSFNGAPYMWGGASSKAFDCSGLTRTAFLLNGVLLPRNASQQVHSGIEVNIDELKAALAVPDAPVTSFGALQKGDLLFFGRKGADGRERITHVGLYIGGGRLIHSSHMVRINSLNPAEPDYYTGSTRLLKARRMCAPDGTPYTEPLIKDSPYYFSK